MSDAETIECPECGYTSRDAEWCDHCGAPVGENRAAEQTPAWLEAGERIDVGNGEVRLGLRIKDMVENFSTRRVVYASVEEREGSVAVGLDETVLVEEREETSGGDGFAIPDEIARLFQRPLVTGRRRGHTLRVYRDRPGMTVEDLVDITNGQLSFKQVVDVFLAVLDAVESVHEAGHLLLAIAPWTVRIEGGALRARVSRAEDVTEASLGETRSDATPAPPTGLDEPTSEAEIDIPAEAIGTAEAPDEPTERDMAPDAVVADHEDSDARDVTLEVRGGLPSEPDEGEVVEEVSTTGDPETESVEGEREPGDASVADVEEPPSVDEESVETADAQDGGLDEHSQGGPDETERDEELAEEEALSPVAEDDEVVEPEEDGEMAGSDEPEAPDGDVADELFDPVETEEAEETASPASGISEWDIFDEEELADEDDRDDTNVDALGQTNVVSYEGRFEEDDPPVEASFVGIERLTEIDGQAEEVPVILGFAPPEMLGRSRSDLGLPCDVFELGMLLYVLISGHAPPASVYTRYTPALPVRNFRPGFPPGLQPIISRATRPAPADRYPDVATMRDAFLNACELMERRAAQTVGEDTPQAVMAVDTHVGIAKGRRNPTNQDAVFGRMSDDGRFGLMVVADGVSTATYGSGDLASHFLTKHAARVWETILPNYLMDERIDEVEIIRDILDGANEEIVEYVNEKFQPFIGNPHEVMGTTGLVSIVRDGIVTLASLGDSRAYIHNAFGLEQVTVDHNLWTLSILDGLTADSALAMPHGDALARCLGTFVIADGRLLVVPPEPDLFRFALSRGETLLLTTDGLIDFAGPNSFTAEENVHAVLLAEPDPALACLELILLANRGGGGDNIGVGITQFV